MPCRTLRSISNTKGVMYRDVLLVCVSPWGVRLTENTREARIGGHGSMWRLTMRCCDSHRYELTRRRGSNGVGFNMYTRLLGPKGMNGLKMLSSTRLLVKTNLPTRHQPAASVSDQNYRDRPET